MTGSGATPPPSDPGALVVIGLLLFVAGGVLLFLSAGGPSVAAARWRSFKLWLLRKIAWGFLLLGVFLFFEAVVRH